MTQHHSLQLANGRLCCNNLLPLLLLFIIGYPDFCQAASQVILDAGDDSTNSNAPVFKYPIYHFYVEENLQPRLTIGRVIATDLDAMLSGEISYELDATMPDGRLFRIAAYTGELMTDRQLDREQAELLKFAVIARDRGSPPRSARVPVEVRVLDVNDNPPRFDQQMYLFQVFENQGPNLLVGVLRARDRDAGHNAWMSFAIVQPTSRQLPFRIVRGSETGVVEIRTTAGIDREKDAFFEFFVQVRDSGTPALTIECAVRIAIGDRNDNSI